MDIKRLFSVIVIGWVIANLAQAQSKLTGEIYTTDGFPIADAVVVLKDSLDHATAYHIAYSDSLGRFFMENPDKRANQLFVSRLGYKPVFLPFLLKTSRMRITLEKDGNFSMDEVVVKGVRQRTKVENDRLVYDMETNPFSNDNALEAFKYVPFIASDGQHFSIIGKSETKIYVNGREKKLAPDALNDYLKGLPAERIKNIEVIHSPNSSFRGEGNFGIINIQLKQNEDEGLQGSLSAQVWRTHYMKERGNLNLMYHKNRLTLNGTAGFANQSDWKKDETESFLKESATTTWQESKITGFTRRANGTIDWEYQLSDKDELGGNVSFSYSKLDWTDKGRLKQAGADKEKALNVRHDNDLERNRTDAGVNLFYQRRFNQPGQVLNIDFDYTHSRNKQFVWNRMDNLDDNLQYLSPYNYYQENVPQNSNVWSGKIEYRQNAGKNQWTAGVDSYYSKIDNKDTFMQGTDDGYVNDEEQSNHFALQEWTSAFFISWEREWNSRFSTRLGSRLEYTDYTTRQYTLGEKTETDFVRVLPNLYISYHLSPDHVFSYIFSNRMERPVFSLFNPFKVYTSATSYTTGNEKLEPEIMYGQTFQYQFFKRYIFQASYQRVKNQIYELTFATDEDMQVTTPVNAGIFEYALLALNTNTSYMKNYANLDITVSYLWQRMKAIEYEGVHAGGYHNGVFQVDLNNNFTLSEKHKLSFDINVSYNTKDLSFYTETPEKLYLYGQLKKRFKACQLSLYGFCNLYRYDGKVTTRWRNKYETDNMQRISLIQGEPVGIGIRFSYTFGNKKVNGTQERKTSGTEAKRRL